MNEERKRWGLPEKGLLLVLLASVLYVALLAGGNPEVFLIDDNRTQWYPVMERAFEDFWRTGRIYCYDFYQMKGMPVAEQGYYGVMNPLMLLSYTAAEILPGGMDAITFYIGLMVVLGNLFFYLICRRFGCKQVPSFLLAVTYGTMGCFWAFYVWYYVFNNYFMVSLLIYVFLRCTREGKLMYCACGVVLAMDLWMGNVQYTFYHYILFGVLCLTMMILKNKRYFMALCTNAAVGIGLSLPMLLLLMQASGGFQKQEEFMKYPLWYFSLLIHSAIPQGILRRHGDGFSFLDSFVMERDDNLVCYMGIVGVLLLAAVVCAVVRFLKLAGALERRHRYGGETQAGAAVCADGFWEEFRKELRSGYERAAGWSHEKKTAAGCAGSFFFFLSLMSGGAAAYFLGMMPVVHNFRYLFKAIFTAVPLAVVILAYLVGAAERGTGADRYGNSAGKRETVTGNGEKRAAETESRKMRCVRLAAALLAAVFACVGVVNACDTVKVVRHMFDMRIEGNFAEEKEAALSALAAAGVDGKNYRTAAFLQFPGVNDECFDLSRNMTRNFPTAIGAFSLAGYEVTAEKSRLKMFDAVYTDTDFYAAFTNAETLERFNISLQQKPEKVEKQLIENSVRYLLLDKTALADNRMAQEKKEFLSDWQDRREDVIAALRTLPGIHVERVCAFNDRYDLVEIVGVESLCMDGAGNRVPLTDENMQTLSFDGEAGQNYILSFAWDRYLKAFVTEADGMVRTLPVEKTENGNVRLSTAGSAGGRVTLTWHDPLCTAGFVWEGLTALAFLSLLAALAFYGKKCYSN